MIEKTILDHLSASLEVACGMEVPANAPASFVVLEKTGTSRKNRIGTAILAVQSYAPTLYEAACLNERVKTGPAITISPTQPPNAIATRPCLT